MKFKRKKWYIEVETRLAFYFINKDSRETKIRIYALYAYPFFITHPDLYTQKGARIRYARKKLRNGMKIHYAQQREMFFIFYCIFFIVERLYFLCIKRYSIRQSLYAVSFQREMQSNLENFWYPKHRKRFASFDYFWTYRKPPITTVASGGRIVFEEEVLEE